jgi:tetratricopeptide (TPR) repeat protein
VLEGSVRKAARRVRVTTRLVGVEDGYELWSERYDGTLDDVFAFEDEIARATVEKLRVALFGAAEAAEAPTGNPRAYEWYLRGRHAWNRRTEEGLNQSVDYLARAIGEDPDFALAHAGLADAYVMLGVYGARAPDDVMPQAAAAAERALALQPQLGEALTALGCVHAVYRWDWDAAERAFRRAIELNPRYPTARHWFAINCLAPRGRLGDGLAELRLARGRDPLSPPVNVSIGLLAYFARDYQAATACYRDVLAADPGFGMAHYFWGEVHEAERRIPESVAAFRKAAELVGYTPEATAGLARASALAGDRATAERLLEELRASAALRFVSPVAMAHVHIGLGAADEAFRWLERAVDTHDAELIWLGVRPAFDPLRSDPRFAALLSRVNLAAR